MRTARARGPRWDNLHPELRRLVPLIEAEARAGPGCDVLGRLVRSPRERGEHRRRHIAAQGSRQLSARLGPRRRLRIPRQARAADVATGHGSTLAGARGDHGAARPEERRAHVGLGLAARRTARLPDGRAAPHLWDKLPRVHRSNEHDDGIGRARCDSAEGGKVGGSPWLEPSFLHCPRSRRRCW